MSEKIFVDGLIYKLPREGSPEFVKGSLSIKVDEFIQFLNKHQNQGWVNLDFLKSKKGILYFVLNEYNKNTQNNPQTAKNTPSEQSNVEKLASTPVDVNVQDLPF